MPTRSAGGAPAGAISELGLPARAVTALTRAGVTSTVDLAALTRRDLAAVPGLGAGMIAAIRAVVPEPGRSGDLRAPDPEQESPAAPAIPSFASLRAPQRRTAMDLLVPGLPPELPADAAPGAPGPPSMPSLPTTPGPPPMPGPSRAPGAPRPAEYGDLLRIGVHLAHAVAGVPVRAVRWSLREPVRALRWLLG